MLENTLASKPTMELCSLNNNLSPETIKKFKEKYNNFSHWKKQIAWKNGNYTTRLKQFYRLKRDHEIEIFDTALNW